MYMNVHKKPTFVFWKRFIASKQHLFYLNNITAVKPTISTLISSKKTQNLNKKKQEFDEYTSLSFIRYCYLSIVKRVIHPLIIQHREVPLKINLNQKNYSCGNSVLRYNNQFTKYLPNRVCHCWLSWFKLLPWIIQITGRTCSNE